MLRLRSDTRGLIWHGEARAVGGRAKDLELRVKPLGS